MDETNKMNRAICLIFMLFSSLINAACDNKNVADKAHAGSFPVEWYEGVSISDWLKQPVSFKDVVNIGSLLDAGWNYTFTVYSASDSEKGVVVASCRDYLNVRGKGYSPVSMVDAGPFMGVAMKCSAIEALANAKAAKKSYLRDFSLDESLPEKLPKQMAFMASTSEYERMVKDPAIKSLTDVHKITQTQKNNLRSSTYSHSGGVQEMMLVGKGDFNADGVLDLLLMIQNNVIEGSFSSTHLYALTRMTSNGGYVLLKEYEY